MPAGPLPHLFTLEWSRREGRSDEGCGWVGERERACGSVPSFPLIQVKQRLSFSGRGQRFQHTWAMWQNEKALLHLTAHWVR
jgi:hypothetical protein